jgi:AcrR family transcriptional regulator
MANGNTVDKILDAAQELFAERGFAETSLRMITSKAGVNLAAVNYHFGSKEALIQATFSRFLTPFSREFKEQLNAYIKQVGEENVDIAHMIAVLAASAQVVAERNDQSVAIFMRLMGLAYAQAQSHLRNYLKEHYSDVFKPFMRTLKTACPEMTPIEWFWRIHFVLGTLAFTMSSVDSLQAMAANDLSVDSQFKDMISYLAKFVSAGLMAPAT